jgi:4-hydroxybenzoate polyprenyltransferase
MQRLLLIAAWILVLAPLSWGVARSVQRSMPLFTADKAAGAPLQNGLTTPTQPTRP